MLGVQADQHILAIHGGVYYDEAQGNAAPRAHVRLKDRFPHSSPQQEALGFLALGP